MWILLGLCIAFLCFLDYYKKVRVDARANFPGPTVFPFVGTIFEYLNHTPDTILEKAIQDFKKYKGNYRTWIFNTFFIVINDPDDIESIISTSKNMKKNEIYDMMKPWLKEGLLISHGAKWFQRRKIITPAFHFSMLEQFVQIFDEQSNILVDKLRPHAVDGQVFDINNYIALAALDAISESALGIKINAQTDTECAYVKAIHDLSRIVIQRFLKVTQRFDFLFCTISYFTKRKHDKLLRILHSFTQNIIDERRKSFEREKNAHQRNEDNMGKKNKLAFLDLLLNTTIDGKPLSDVDIREEVDTFTFEGHDTVTSGICFTLFLISRHPEVQRKLFDEIREIFRNDKIRPAAYKDLQQLKYMELVIKEALRMYPPVPAIGRIIDEDLKIGDKLLPAGSTLNLSLIVTMKNSKYFPDPDKFIPERHSAENSAETLNPFAFIPFSAGPRNCIGQKFAMLEMKSIISKILRHYELLPLGKDVKLYVGIILRSSSGYQMGLKSRDY